MKKRSVLYLVDELLPVEMRSRFFLLTTLIWHEYYTNLKSDQSEQQEHSKVYHDKARVILNNLLATL